MLNLNRYNISTFNINPEQIICSSFSKKKEKFELNAYQKFDLENLEFYGFNIYNFSNLFSLINSFIIKYNLKNSFAFIALPQNNLNNKNDKEFSTVKLTSDYCIVLPYSLIFQLKTLFNYLDLNILNITTENICIAKLLENFKPQALEDFPNFDKVIDLFDINNLIINNTKYDIEAEKKDILKNLGLHLIEI